MLWKAALGATWIGAAVFLGSNSAASHSTLRVVAAIFIALPAGWQFGARVVGHFDQLNSDTRQQVQHELQRAIVAVHRERVFDYDITRLSLHVWVLPQWYRRLLGVGVFRHHVKRRREVSKKRERKPPRWANPQLECVAMYRFQRHRPSGVNFRQGDGIVGRCIDENLKTKILTVALDSVRFKEALKSDEQWNAAPIEIRHNLRRRPAEHLADVYGQAAAIVLQDSGHAIGCLTLELPPHSETRLTDDKGGFTHHPIFEHLRSAVESVEDYLTPRAR